MYVCMYHEFATGVTQRTDLYSQGQYNYKLFEIHCQIFNILERTRHLPMLNYKTNVHIDRQAQPRKPGFLSRLRRGKTLVTAGHVTLENPQNLGKN